MICCVLRDALVNVVFSMFKALCARCAVLLTLALFSSRSQVVPPQLVCVGMNTVQGREYEEFVEHNPSVTESVSLTSSYNTGEWLHVHVSGRVHACSQNAPRIT